MSGDAPETKKRKKSKKGGPGADAGRVDGAGSTELPPLTAERVDWGDAIAREQVDRSAHAEWTAPPARQDPVAILKAESATRIASLVPIRHGRMLETPFTFFRGAAAIMAADLAPLPTSRLYAQSSGDAHLLNFGVFAAPDRRLVFDLNDFDQTLPAPIEWDLKRLAASCVIAARDVDASEDEARTVAHAAIEAYRVSMWRYASMRHLDVFYDRVEIDDELSLLSSRADKKTASRVRKDLAKAEGRTSLGSLEQFAERQPDGSFLLHESPPLVERLDAELSPEIRSLIADDFDHYTRTLDPEKATVMHRYRFQDAARKVVGVGSVGIEAYILLFAGDRDDDPLFLQLKEVRESVLAPYAGPSIYEHQGERVVRGQKLMQTSGDAFLGWLKHPTGDGPDYYMRQLRDKKGSIKIERITQDGLTLYAAECGAVLARAHARSGDSAQMAGYLGTGSEFADAVTEFAVAYADQNQADHEAFLQAEADGRIEVQRGL
ncbi:MAG: DUF2252 domain-containing protein [Solirubrobacteraceae bacterium]|nr:DUF2252 domain-containing protein [Solirubrobacteraceae bacterium]